MDPKRRRARAIARELPGDASAARPALQSEPDRVAMQRVDCFALSWTRNTVVREPSVDLG
jgi:hypothetical protein